MPILQLVMSKLSRMAPKRTLVALLHGWLAVSAFATQSTIRGGTGGNTAPQAREAYRGCNMNHHHEPSGLASVINRQRQT